MQDNDRRSGFPGGSEWFYPHPHGKVQDHALTPDEVKAEYENASKQRIVVNKTTQRIRFENETESEVTVVIEPKNETLV